MTFLHKLAHRLARLKRALIMGLVATIACELPARIAAPLGSVSRLALSPKNSTLLTDQMTQFMVVGLTPAGDTASVAVNWNVTGGSIIDTSSSGGRHYGQYKAPSSPGRYKVVAQTNSGGLADSAVVDVSAVPVASVTVSPASASVTVGNTVQLAATPRDSTGTPLTGRAVSWSSSNPGAAAVDANGLVTGMAAGAATITATSEGKSGAAAVTVTQVPVASVSVSPATASVMVGQTVQLTATPRDANGNPLSGRVVMWATGNAAVATVNSSGRVTGVAAGTATITATSEGQSGTAAVTATNVAVGPWPHEPGLTLVTDNPWNSLTAPGWRWVRASANKDPDIFADATAPGSPPNTARHIFTAGMPAGDSPQTFWYSAYRAGYREVYFAWWFKYSANFPVGAQGLTKLTYIFIADQLGNTLGSAWTAVVGPNPIDLSGGPPYYLGYHIQWAPYGAEQTLLPNVTATPINKDEWHLVEWYVKFPSVPGTTSDGIVRIWVDGVKNHEWANIRMPADAAEFGEFQHEPVAQVVTPTESYLYIDHTRITAR